MTKRFEDDANGMKQRGEIQAQDGNEMELEQALKDFKSSLYAWSEAAYSRPRMVTRDVRHRSWRMALGWATGCLLVAGSVSGGLIERQHRLAQERNAAYLRAAQQQQQESHAQQGAADTDEALLVDVDSDVSQQVPSAMEPLARMMSEDETKQTRMGEDKTR
jgi:hypothetical protein